MQTTKRLKSPESGFSAQESDGSTPPSLRLVAHQNYQDKLKPLDQMRIQLLEDVSALGEIQLNWKPGEESWSIAQIIQHLVLSDETYGRSFEQNALPSEKLLFRLVPRNWRLKMILKAMREDKNLPIPSPSVDPIKVSDVPLSELAQRWDTAQANIQRTVDSPRVDMLRYFHPVIGAVTVSEMLELKEAHIAYHMRQIDKLRAMPGYPRPELEV